MTRSTILEDMDDFETLFSKNDYWGDQTQGPDHLVVVAFGSTPVLCSAPHATKQLRLNGEVREMKEEDQGTGSLAWQVARMLGGTFMAICNQTGDANTDKKAHPFKVHQGELVRMYGLKLAVDFHGMSDSTASEKIKGRIGVGMGAHPSPATALISQLLQVRGKEAGIKVKTGNSLIAAISDNNVTTTLQREFGAWGAQLEFAPEARNGEGNDEPRLANVNLVTGVLTTVLEQIPLLDQLAQAIKLPEPVTI